MTSATEVALSKALFPPLFTLCSFQVLTSVECEQGVPSEEHVSWTQKGMEVVDKKIVFCLLNLLFFLFFLKHKQFSAIDNITKSYTAHAEMKKVSTVYYAMFSLVR